MAGKGSPFDGTHHCAILPADEHGANHKNFKDCKLNRGHKKFFTVDEFRERLSHDDKDTREHFENAHTIIDRTVRIVVSYTSTGRPDTYPNSNIPYPFINNKGNCNKKRYGTGFLPDRGCSVPTDRNDPCPCPTCRISACNTQKPENYYFFIRTATHVIFDEQEAQAAVFEFFYDSEDRAGVEFLYGVAVLGSRDDRLTSDICEVVCVTHDRSLADRLKKLSWVIPMFDILVSHPHGVSKRITIGDFSGHIVYAYHNKASVKIRKDKTVRFFGCPDDKCVIESINKCLMDKETVTGLVDEVERMTLTLLNDITIYFPADALLQIDIDSNFSYKTPQLRLPPGVELVTENGKRCSIPHNQDRTHDIMMEVIPNDDLADNNMFPFSIRSLETCKLWHLSFYDMASCPGSSGAAVFYRGFPGIHYTEAVHFGCLGAKNRSGLDYVGVGDSNI